MQGTALVDYVQNHVRDTGADTFSVQIILDALNDTYYELGELLPISLLTELITPQTTVGTIASGKVVLTATGNLYVTDTPMGSYERSIIRAYDATNSKWMRRINDASELNNSFLTPTIYDPGFRISGSTFYVYPTTGITSVLVDYIKKPAAITDADVTGVPLLNASLHYLLAKGAEFRVRATLDDKNNLTAIVQNDYYKEIAELNKKAGA